MSRYKALAAGLGAMLAVMALWAALWAVAIYGAVRIAKWAWGA